MPISEATGPRADQTVLGIDPDNIEMAVAAGLTGHPIRTGDWCTLDEMIETITD